MACGWVVLTIQQPEWTGVSTSLIGSHPLLPQLFSRGFTRLSYQQQNNKTKTINFSVKTFVVFTSRKVRLSAEVPCLNTPVLFPFGGETHKRNFPLFVDNFARNLCCFFIDFRIIHLDDLFLEWTSPLLPNDIRLELASLLKSNNKTAVKHQTLFCFIQKTPYQNEAKWTVSLFENVQGKSSPKWICPKILKKVDTLF